MTYIILLIIVLLFASLFYTIFIGYIYESNYGLDAVRSKVSNLFDKRPSKFENAHLVKVILELDEESLSELFKLYKKEFGAGAASYARQTYRKWKTGSVRPNRHTFNRFLYHLPKVMSYDLKCEVLRRMMEEYCAKNDYKITVYTDDWEEALNPLVKDIIEKSQTAQLPKQLESKLRWLAEDEMQAAQSILKKSQAQQSKVAVSMLRDEISNIENLLAQTEGRSKVTHQLKFPYGTITLKIKRR